MKKPTYSSCFREARDNAAGLIESLDGEQLFGDNSEAVEKFDDAGELYETAQADLVKRILQIKIPKRSIK